jgi:hypothetical protein
MVSEVGNTLYRVKTTTSGFLVECETLEDLCRYCAQKALQGNVITSVVSISPYTKETPRVRILTTPLYRKVLREEMERRAESVM